MWHILLSGVAGVSCLLVFAFATPSEPLLYWVSLGVTVVCILLLVFAQGTPGGIFSPQGLFLISAICFNAGQALVRSLGVVPKNGIFTDLPPELGLRTLLFVGFGLIIFSGGMTLAFRTAKRPDSNRSFGSTSKSTLLQVGFGMLALGFPFWVYYSGTLMQRVAQYGRSLGYFGIQHATGSGRIPELLGDFFPAGIMWILAGSRSRSTRLIALLSGVIVVATQLALGERSIAFPFAVAFVWLWHVTVRPVRRVQLLVAGVFGLIVVIPGIGASREAWGPNGFSFSYLIESYAGIENPALQGVSEMGWSATTIGYTMDLIPSIRGWDFGRSYLWGSLVIFPNVGSGPHPAKAHGYLSEWLVGTLAPQYAAQGGGFGFSFLAEAYANGGWVGAPLLLFVQGFALGAFGRFIYRKRNPAVFAMGACVLLHILFYARGESADLFRDVAWHALIPYVVYTALSRHRNQEPLKLEARA